MKPSEEEAKKQLLKAVNTRRLDPNIEAFLEEIAKGLAEIHDIQENGGNTKKDLEKMKGITMDLGDRLNATIGTLTDAIEYIYGMAIQKEDVKEEDLKNASLEISMAHIRDLGPVNSMKAISLSYLAVSSSIVSYMQADLDGYFKKKKKKVESDIFKSKYGME